MLTRVFLPAETRGLTVCSKSEIRYEGTLFAIDTKDSTVTLQNGASNACVVTARYLAPASQPPVPCEPAHTDRELAHTDRDVLSRRWQFAVPTVRSFGTEDRPAPSKIAASTEVYEYIIFRGSDIKDLQVRLPRPASGMVAPAALSPDSSPPPPPPIFAGVREPDRRGGAADSTGPAGTGTGPGGSIHGVL